METKERGKRLMEMGRKCNFIITITTSIIIINFIAYASSVNLAKTGQVKFTMNQE